jgi:hypothetical protein
MGDPFSRLALVLRLLLQEHDIYDVDTLAAFVNSQGAHLAAWLGSDEVRERAAAYGAAACGGAAAASSTVDVGMQKIVSTAEVSTATDGTGRQSASCMAKPKMVSHGAQTARRLYGASRASQTSVCAVADAETSVEVTTVVDAAVGTRVEMVTSSTDTIDMVDGVALVSKGTQTMLHVLPPDRYPSPANPSPLPRSSSPPPRHLPPRSSSPPTPPMLRSNQPSDTPQSLVRVVRVGRLKITVRKVDRDKKKDAPPV